MSMFKKTPICEECGKGEAVSFSFVGEYSPIGKGHWKFCCECTESTESRFIQIDQFFSSPSATVDWMAHMHEKTWMDWNDFMNMMTRFREATGSNTSL